MLEIEVGGGDGSHVVRCVSSLHSCKDAVDNVRDFFAEEGFSRLRVAFGRQADHLAIPANHLDALSDENVEVRIRRLGYVILSVVR